VTLSIYPLQRPQEKGIPESQGAQNTSTTENTNSTQKPSQPHPQAAPTTSQPPTSTNQSNGNSEAENVHVQRWIEIFTGVLAGVGVLQLVVMFLTWMVYRRQAGIMEQQRATMQSQWTTMQGQLSQMAGAERQTERLITEAKKSADAAKESADEMRMANKINLESLQAVQRAYISFQMQHLKVRRWVDLKGDTQGWSFDIPIENTGNTPTRELAVHVNWIAQDCKLQNGELPDNFDYPDQGDSNNLSPDLPAKARPNFNTLDISKNWIERLHGKQVRLFFYGWSTYRDAFENTLSIERSSAVNSSFFRSLERI
jgi:hypothetical protein